MKILTGSNIREADFFTMREEPVSSVDLMERASSVMTDIFCSFYRPDRPVAVFAGRGNNGGDGIVMCRLLFERDYDVSLYLFCVPEEMSDDSSDVFEKLPPEVPVHYACCTDDGYETDGSGFPLFRDVDGDVSAFSPGPSTVILDAILGSGLRGAAGGRMACAIRSVNSLGLSVVSVDMPSGLSPEPSSAGGDTVFAERTITVGFPKLSMLLPDIGECAGRISVADIGLSRSFMASCPERMFYFTAEDAEGIVPVSGKFMHKGDRGHVLAVCGRTGMMGAAVLAVSAALRSGCGLVTAHIPSSERFIMNVSCPCAVLSLDPSDCFSVIPSDMSRYDAVCAGCGLGTSHASFQALRSLLQCAGKIVLDADAINMIAADSSLLQLMPEGAVLTPHPGELARLVGMWDDDTEKIALVRDFCSRYSVVMVVKGAHTMVCMPDGSLYFNSTGNEGMAKGGSGDVLAGYMAGLMARGLDPEEAALLAVFRHGTAGDRAAAELGAEYMNASDLIGFLR